MTQIALETMYQTQAFGHLHYIIAWDASIGLAESGSVPAIPSKQFHQSYFLPLATKIINKIDVETQKMVSKKRKYIKSLVV